MKFYSIFAGVICQNRIVMDNVYAPSDAILQKRIGKQLGNWRLQQNRTQTQVSQDAQISLSSLQRLERGEIKSFETLLRVLRTLGKLDTLNDLVKEEPLSPSQYFKLVSASKAKQRKRAGSVKSNIAKKGVSEW